MFFGVFAEAQDVQIIKTYIPGDSMYVNMDYLRTMEMEKVWTDYNGVNQVVVAVIDSGVDLDHPDLMKNIWHNYREIPGNGKDDDYNGYTDDYNGWDFADNDSNPSPVTSTGASYEAMHHGTFIAGIIAAEHNGNGTVGVGKGNIKIMPIRAVAANGIGDINAVIKGIYYAVDHGARVINMSFISGKESLELKKAIQYAWDHGVLIVAAAGNGEYKDGAVRRNLNDKPLYPVCSVFSDNIVIGVGSIAKTKSVSVFSNVGDTCVDIYAIGEQIISTLTYEYERSTLRDTVGTGWWGTSLATGFVSAAAAYIMSEYPYYTNSEIRDLLINNATPLGSEGTTVRALNIVDSIIKAITIVPHTVLAVIVQENGKYYLRIVTTEGNIIQSFLIYRGALDDVQMTTGDFDADGVDEIAVSYINGRKSIVDVFEYDGIFRTRFQAYGDLFIGGVRVDTIRRNGPLGRQLGGKWEKDLIVTVPYRGGGPHVRVFDMFGKVYAQWFALSPKLIAGYDVDVRDLNADGNPEVAVILSDAREGWKKDMAVSNADGSGLVQYESGRNNRYGKRLYLTDDKLYSYSWNRLHNYSSAYEYLKDDVINDSKKVDYLRGVLDDKQDVVFTLPSNRDGVISTNFFDRYDKVPIKNVWDFDLIHLRDGVWWRD